MLVTGCWKYAKILVLYEETTMRSEENGMPRNSTRHWASVNLFNARNKRAYNGDAQANEEIRLVKRMQSTDGRGKGDHNNQKHDWG